MTQQIEKTAGYWIKTLEMEKHPEGGYYSETYRSQGIIPGSCLPNEYDASRNYFSVIYFLLPSGDVSKFHKLHSDELWCFHTGSPVEIYCLNSKGILQINKLGFQIEKGETLQQVIHSGVWFGAQVTENNSFALVSCIVAPAFDFNDFELAKREELIREYPQHEKIISLLTD